MMKVYTMESLKESEANLKAIIENSIESIWAIDTNYRIQFVNEVFVKAFKDAFGVQLKQGMNILEAIPKSLREVWKERYDRAFKKEHFVFTEKIELENRDIYIEVAMNPIVIEGKVIGASFYGKDISKRTSYELQLLAAKEKAEESEERYNALFNRSTDFVYIHDLEGNFIDANNATLDMFGYGKDEIRSLNFTSLVEEKDLPRALNEIKKLLKHGSQKKQVEFKLKKRNGELVFVEIISSLVFKEGIPVAIQGIARNISDRKKAQESLQKLSLAINQSNDIVFITNREGIITFLNPQFTTVYGFTADEVLDKVTPRILKSGLFSTDESAYLWKKILNKESIKTEYKNKRKDGTFIDIEGSADPILNEQGDIIGFLGIHRDISERKRVEEDLIKAKEAAEEREKELKYSQKIARIGYYILDFKSGSWTSSEMLDEIFGITKEYDRNVENWISLVHPDYQAEMREYFNTSILKNREQFNKQYKIIDKKTKKSSWVHGYGTLEYDENGDLSKMFGTIQDITQSKKTELELQEAKDKAVESDSLKTAFLANMSHEIRTPMNGILGFLALLGKEDLSNEEKERFVDIINSSADRLLSTIDDIIEISKIESGNVAIVNSEVNIPELLTFYHNFFLPEAQAKDLQFTLELTPNMEMIRVLTDKSKLDSILSNLLKNAIKFTKKGKIVFGYELVGDQLRFFVKDTGIGINKGSVNAIFDRFVQSEISMSKALEGSGIGLSISKAYVEMLGGEISVESEEYKGSIFTFSIPAIKWDSATQAADILVIESERSDPEHGPYKNAKILIAEDDIVSSKYLKTILAEIDCEILICHTGHEAVELCRNIPDIDLILMDIRMPVLNGYEATQKIREFNNDIFIIAQTAYALDGDERLALNAGCNAYITKPIDKKKLFSLIEKHDSGHRP